jgi:hypothetical protein
MLRHLTTHLYDNAYLLLSFTALCWAGNQVDGRTVAGHIPPKGARCRAMAQGKQPTRPPAAVHPQRGTIT